MWLGKGISFYQYRKQSADWYWCQAAMPRSKSKPIVLAVGKVLLRLSSYSIAVEALTLQALQHLQPVNHVHVVPGYDPKLLTRADVVSSPFASIVDSSFFFFSLPDGDCPSSALLYLKETCPTVKLPVIPVLFDAPLSGYFHYKLLLLFSKCVSKTTESWVTAERLWCKRLIFGRETQKLPWKLVEITRTHSEGPILSQLDSDP